MHVQIFHEILSCAFERSSLEKTNLKIIFTNVKQWNIVLEEKLCNPTAVIYITFNLTHILAYNGHKFTSGLLLYHLLHN
jgi:hypothetical protein